MNFIKNRKSILLIFLLTFVMIFSQGTLFINTAKANTAELIITGTGLKEEVTISEDDWSNYSMIEQIYSGNNSLNFHKIIKAKGYNLFELIGKGNLKSDDNYDVKFTCSDGFEFTKRIEDLTETYSFPDFTIDSKENSQAMIARYTAVLADFPKNIFSPPVSWEDRPLTEDDLDKDFPKLVFGQKNIDDMNLSKWGKEVIKITVGEELPTSSAEEDSPYKHISYDGAPYNVDSITGATLTVEGPALKGYRALSLRQLEEDIEGQEVNDYNEKVQGDVVENSYEGINVSYLIDNYVKIASTPGNVVFKDKSRQKILSVPFEEVEEYLIAYGINEVPLVYLETDVGYKENKNNADGCFKLVYPQEKSSAEEFSNLAYIYIEEKDAQNIYEHSYPPYNLAKYTDYEIIIHGDAMDEEVRYTVDEIETMEDIKHEDEYSLSNSEYFWYYNTYKGVTLWDLLLEAGVSSNIDEDTSIQFIAADNYNFPPMTIGEIKNNSLYGYYEKDANDIGDGTFDGSKVKPLYTDTPVLVAYGFNGYPYVVRPNDDGYNPGLGNDGGPLRVIFGKTRYNDPNGANQVQFLKEIIIGGGNSISTGEVGQSGNGESTHQKIDENSSWNHNNGEYKKYLDEPVLRVTGTQVKEPMTFTLRQIESLLNYAVRDIYTGDGVMEFEGIVLWDLISEVVGIKDGVDVPSIRVFSGPNYNQILRSFDQVSKGVLNSKGETKEIILAYAVEGYPLVPNESDIGYANNNAYGPLRLIVEESKSMWVKWTDCIVVGTGDYEEPKLEDVKEIDLPDLPQPSEKEEDVEKDTDKIWLTFKNSTGKEMSEASVRSMEYDNEDNLWIGTNSGGISVRSPEGKWSHIKTIITSNEDEVDVDTTYALLQRENGELWMSLGGPTDPKGVAVKDGNIWKIYNTENTILPACFVQELESDNQGGLWIGTKNGLVHVSKDDEWILYTEAEGLLPYSVDAIDVDSDGGVWVGYYPGNIKEGDTTLYKGGYQYLSPEGEITTYQGFDEENFNVNWVRSISIDAKGGVWIVRSGNAPGFTQGVADYILDGERTTYTAKDLYPNIGEDDDIRLLLADKNEENSFYIATLKSGLLKSEGLSNITKMYNSDTAFPSKKWDSVYFLDINEKGLMIGSNGGAGLYTDKLTFQDIENHWAKNSIEKMATLKYVKGIGMDYKPDDTVTRAEFSTIITRVLGLGLENDDKDNIYFNDVSSEDWFAPYIKSISAEGLIKGYNDGNFKPNSPITREEISTILAKALSYKDLSQDETDEVLSRYDDNISDWAKDSVARVVSSGILKGFDDNTFRGSHNATRAQAAVMLLRYLEY